MPIVVEFDSFSRDHTQENPFPIVVPVVPDGDTERGNTSSTPLSASNKRCNPAKQWCFTYNNPDMKFIDFIAQHYRITNYVFQLERGTNGTPHFQGVVSFDVKSRPKSVFGPEYDAIHWEVCKDWDASIRYCQKADTRIRGPWLKGDKVKRFNDLKLLSPEQFYDWQRNLINIIEQEPDDRKIYWVWETEGNRGKTSFCKYLSARYGAVLLTGKGTDMKYAIASMPDYPRIVLIDCPRSMMEYVSYPGLEEIKNGYFFCGKYESKQVIGNPPHMIVFANCEPEYEKLSGDRLEVIHI